MRRIRLLAASISLVLACLGRAASGEPVVVIPAGRGVGVVPSAEVARAIADALNGKKAKPRARLAYLLPAFPPENKSESKQAAKLLKQTQQAFQLMEYQKATELAERALKIYRDVAKSGSFEGCVEALYLVAASALFEEKTQEAYRAMNDAFLLDPRPPPSKRFNPQVQELYQQVVGEPMAKGTVRLRSDPEGALVWFNRQLVGPARGRVKLRGGLYLVRAYLPGYAVLQRWVRIKPHEERQIAVQLTRDESVEAERMEQIRDEAKATEPGGTINEIALDAGASEAIVVTTTRDCQPTRCGVVMRWSKEGKWWREKRGRFGGTNAAEMAALLVGGKRLVTRPRVTPPGPVSAVPSADGTCTMDSQCGLKEKCQGGRCVAPTPLAHKWWFWTLVGAAVAGATVGIVVPLTRPESPVIEVQ